MWRIIGIGALIVVIILVGVLVGLAAGFMGGLPKLSAYKDLGRDQTSKVFAADGTLLATLHAEQNREIIPIADIPKTLQTATISIEDDRFYNHHGVDLKAIIRALYTNIRSGHVSEGGSTLTQQYVSNSFITPEPTLSQKVKEAALAYQLEQKYSKSKILEMYLNTVYFGQGCYGVETTSLNFFHKRAKDLNLAESALLAGLPGAPNYFSPYTNPELAKNRRADVLNRMVKHGYISKKESNEAKNTPIDVFPVTLEEDPEIAPYFVEHVKLSLIDKYGANMVYRGGLRIYTTLDMEMQKKAESAVESMLYEPDDPCGALASIDPKNGYIKALYGGRDFKTNKYNLATQAKRNPGSSFKTFTLVAALENDITPNRTYNASSPKYIKVPDGTWRVENYEGKQFSGSMSLTEATVWSVNVIFAQLIMDVKADKVADVAKKMGITSQVPPYPAIAIGGVPDGVSPLEMASAYATLANDGVYMRPTAIIKITDSEGNIVEEHKPDGKSVIDKNTARITNNILRQVIKRGTGSRADIGRPAGGKTGTAEYKQDAWFVGHTPDLSTAVWIGYPEGSVTMGYIHGYPPYGGSIPALIWKEFMTTALAGVPPTEFIGAEEISGSSGDVRVTICSDSGLIATDLCPNTTTKWYSSGNEPWQSCDIHSSGNSEPSDSETSSVPTVVGLSTGEATSSLVSAGFKVATSEQAHESVPAGIVIDQSPGGGSEASPGSTVTLIVSLGPPEEPEPEP